MYMHRRGFRGGGVRRWCTIIISFLVPFLNLGVAVLRFAEPFGRLPLCAYHPVRIFSSGSMGEEVQWVRTFGARLFWKICSVTWWLTTIFPATPPPPPPTHTHTNLSSQILNDMLLSVPYYFNAPYRAVVTWRTSDLLYQNGPRCASSLGIKVHVAFDALEIDLPHAVIHDLSHHGILICEILETSLCPYGLYIQEQCMYRAYRHNWPVARTSLL